MRLLEGLHSEIRDVQLVCEGSIRFAESAADLKQAGPKNIECVFQGSYAYRAADAAGFLDLYQKPLNSNGDFLHGTYALANRRLIQAVRAAHRKQTGGPVEEKQGGPGSLTIVCSPERFIYLSYWRSHAYGTADIGFECEGWDEVDGSPVLRVSINEAPKSDQPDKPWSRFWIDMNRGGHALKREFGVGSVLWFRDSNIRLGRLSLPGGKVVWLPVRGERDTFLWGKGHRTTPVIHETYDVVRSSVIFNQGLTDQRFSIRWKGPRAESAALKGVAREYETTPKPDTPRLRSDPVGIKEWQEQRLAEADRQSKQLDASPPGQRGWDSYTLWQGGLASVGTGMLATAFFLGRRSR